MFSLKSSTKENFKSEKFINQMKTWIGLKSEVVASSVSTPGRNNIIWKLFNNWSLQGFKYIGKSDRSLVERILWIFIITGCLTISAHLIQIGIVGPLLSRPVIIAFSPVDISVDRIPFPAITVCNVNKLKRSPLEQLKHEYDKGLQCSPYNNSTSDYTTEKCGLIQETAKTSFAALQYLANLCKQFVSFTKMFDYSAESGNIPYDMESPENKQGSNQSQTWSTDVKNPAYLKVRSKFIKAATNCSEMILKCTWQAKVYPCNRLFSTALTKFGTCCSYDKVPKSIRKGKTDLESRLFEPEMDDAEWDAWANWNIDDDLIKPIEEFETKGDTIDVPRHQHQPGMGKGLSIVVNPELTEYHCKAMDGEGFRVVSHSPIELPHVAEFGKAVAPDTETFVAVSAEVTVIDKDVKLLSLDTRKCYVEGEFVLKTSKYYTATNCFDECIANITFTSCGCLRYYQPIEPGRQMCGLHLDVCVQREFDKIAKVGLHKKCPKCLPSCSEVHYFLETSSLPLRNDVPLWKNKTTELNEQWAGENVSIMHFYFGSNYAESRVRRSVYGIKEIIANAGGLLGLTIGFGLISLVELVYHLIFVCFK